MRNGKNRAVPEEKHGFAKLRMALPPEHNDSGNLLAPVRNT